MQYGCKEELSLRSASIIAVERLRDEILKLKTEEIGAEDGQRELNSVLIDFFLWDPSNEEYLVLNVGIPGVFGRDHH